MRRNSGLQLLVLGGLLMVVLSGCATYPVSKGLREQAQPITLAQVSQNPAAYKGATVIWGGRIIQTVNDTNGAAIYLLQLPLTKYEVPLAHAVPTGRFIVRSKRFLDPEFFRRGRLLTVAGEIMGVETHPLQNVQYAYPVLAAKELHLWFMRTPYPPGPWPLWGWDWSGPGWWPGAPPWLAGDRVGGGAEASWEWDEAR